MPDKKKKNATIDATSVRVAFFRGSWLHASDAAIMLYERLSREVHAEVWFHDVSFSVYCNACPTMRVRALDSSDADGSEWDSIEIPVTDHRRALQILMEMKRSPAPYHINVMECALPKRFVDAIEEDEDCMHPEQWSGLFCSQFALLFVRRCALEGILGVSHSRCAILWSVNSKGCLPARLWRILAEMNCQ